jgi:riboflavin kinase/FMN adenylyltransferase
MNRSAQFDGIAEAKLPARSLHLAIGMFDGVHRGHRVVIEAAVQAARESGGISAVLTFTPHPSALFRPENPTRLMLPDAVKAQRVLGLGVDAVITQRFTPEIAGIEPADFLRWLRGHLPLLKAVYVGENWKFGKGRQGDVALLQQIAARSGISVFSAPRVNFSGEPISSTRIRAQLAAGDIEQANALLGYTYSSAATVAPGKRLGRTIGFPTLNLPWSPELRPRLGVYAVRVSGSKSPMPLPAVANYGLRPTVEQSTEPRLEVHVLGPCSFGEGDAVDVEWLRFLRPEMKFASVEELRAQIARDRDAAEAFFRG